MSDKCFACDRKLGKSPMLVDTHDDQFVYVGRDCGRLITAAGESGYQPPKGGPRLYPLPLRLETRAWIIDGRERYDFAWYEGRERKITSDGTYVTRQQARQEAYKRLTQ